MAACVACLAHGPIWRRGGGDGMFVGGKIKSPVYFSRKGQNGQPNMACLGRRKMKEL